MASSFVVNDLNNIIAEFDTGINIGANSVTYTGAYQDSRKVTQDSIYFALQGVSRHGIDFIGSAINQGAQLVICDEHVDLRDYASKHELDVQIIQTKHAYDIYARLLALIYHEVTNELSAIVAITGTNGKTTVAQLLAQAFTKLGVKAATIGTAGTGFVESLEKAELTTPDLASMYELIEKYVNQGAKAITLEASSHGLEQKRLQGLAINYAVLTNISQDHLDYHQSMENYKNAKQKLVTDFDLDAAIINKASDYADEFLSQSKAKQIISYALNDNANVAASHVRYHQGTHFDINVNNEKANITSQLFGDINVENLTATAAVLLAYGFTLKDVVNVMPLLQAAKGRLDVVDVNSKGILPTVFIDFAHTPDALQKVLETLRVICDEKQSKLFVVFGCGGDRDKTKRPLMGNVAEKIADTCIVTNDNPRTEDERAIVNDILAGMSTNAVVIYDRYQAIKEAIHQASENDIVLIAGKGHETGQIVKNTVLEFNDKDVASQIMQEMPA